MLCPAVFALSRVPEVGDLAPEHGDDFQSHDGALTSHAAVARIQLCLDMNVPSQVCRHLDHHALFLCLRACVLVQKGALMCVRVCVFVCACEHVCLCACVLLSAAVKFVNRVVVYCMQVLTLLDDLDAEVRGAALRIACVVLTCASGVSSVVGVSSVPRLSDHDDKAAFAVLLSAMASIRAGSVTIPAQNVRCALLCCVQYVACPFSDAGVVASKSKAASFAAV